MLTHTQISVRNRQRLQVVMEASQVAFSQILVETGHYWVKNLGLVSHLQVKVKTNRQKEDGKMTEAVSQANKN